jgi:hypothetical protein
VSIWGWLSALVAIAAAGLWWVAADTVVMRGDKRSTGTIFHERVDVAVTAREQARWNKWAAVATAIAMLFQTMQSIWGTAPPPQCQQSCENVEQHPKAK